MACRSDHAGPYGPRCSRRQKGENMIDAINGLWQLLTVFFTTDVIYMPLFMGMILFNLIFWAVYMLIGLLDPDTWEVRF